MGVVETILAIVAAAGIPSAVFGLFIWWFKRYIDKRAKHDEERESNREKLNVALVQGVFAAISVSEATARAVQRIPDAHCNGDMTAALNFSRKVKNNLRDFLTSQGIHALIDD